MTLAALGDFLARYDGLIIGTIYFVALVLYRRSTNKLLDATLGTARTALDMLDLMEEARDPGREVHERLARALEVGLVKSKGGPDPAGRRVAAMALAASFIENVRRANLTLVPADPPEDA